ncbi:C-type lectin domain-containing protein [Caenorhabditis elegans]|uniref:C-type lectin domain-containing protein n=1 Tax=Caenorhabditis elegans TaxID=6239 RepID=Q4PIT0_CAEEL|nr:C-type lectin domain-containing protein [Caenorhabditis elegans]CCD67753.1 C-type lectin domain-containing protein [Caenorhabditis elegans]|eukprot:NP_001033469.2 Uncharacterized protein CELE_C50E3.15 [Caenorhabditis elegans]
MVTQGNTSNYVALKRSLSNFSLTEPIETCPSPNINLKTCGTGLKYFLRYNDSVCLMIQYQANKFTHQGAQLGCQRDGLKLRGLESERIFVAELATILKKQFQKYNEVAVWVDGKRNSKCETSQNCSSIEDYEFQDDTLHYKSGYKWNTGEPNGLGGEYCLQMYILPDTSSDSHGKIDDVDCSMIENYPKFFALCGMKAK